MTTTTKLIIGIIICVVDYIINKNKTEIWKLLHKKEYNYLTKTNAWFGIYSRYNSWVTSYSWSCTENSLNEEYKITLECLFRDEIYQKAPFEIQKETENLIYKDYLWSRKLAGID